jgi:ferredoxin
MPKLLVLVLLSIPACAQTGVADGSIGGVIRDPSTTHRAGGCCCDVLQSAKRLPNPAEYFSSNFYAAVDPDTCESCGTCEVRCQMEAISSPEGKAVVDRSRCIGCALCVTTCPSGALRLEPNEKPRIPPDDTKAMYLQMWQERCGPWGMAKIGMRKMLGLKI